MMKSGLVLIKITMVKMKSGKIFQTFPHNNCFFQRQMMANHRMKPMKMTILRMKLSSQVRIFGIFLCRRVNFTTFFLFLAPGAIQWQAGAGTLRPHPFTGTPGMNEMPLTNDPIGFFDLFVKEEDFQNIVANTNLYFRQMLPDELTPQSRLHNWKDVDLNDIRKFFALVLSMGCCHKPAIEDYWNTDGINETPTYGRVLSLRRFQEIMKFFHLNDNENLVPAGRPGHDKLHRVRPLYEALCTRSERVYTPQKDHYTGRGMYRVAGKPRLASVQQQQATQIFDKRAKDLRSRQRVHMCLRNLHGEEPAWSWL